MDNSNTQTIHALTHYLVQVIQCSIGRQEDLIT